MQKALALLLLTALVMQASAVFYGNGYGLSHSYGLGSFGLGGLGYGFGGLGYGFGGLGYGIGGLGYGIGGLGYGGFGKFGLGAYGHGGLYNPYLYKGFY